METGLGFLRGRKETPQYDGMYVWHQDYFADGMTEALINDLAQIVALRVISRTSSMQYKGARKSLPEVARILQVDAASPVLHFRPVHSA